jgi:hypothetical protein
MFSATAEETFDLVEKIIACSFPGQDFGLGTKFAAYLSLSRDEMLRIFLGARQKADILLQQFLAKPLEPMRLARDLQKLELDLQLCLLDRLIFCRSFLLQLKHQYARMGCEADTCHAPDLILKICTDWYREKEVHHWLFSNSLPFLLALAKLDVEP